MGKTGAKRTDEVIEDWQNIEELDNFGDLVEEKNELDQQKKEVEARLKELNTEIEASMAAVGKKKLAWEDKVVVACIGRAPSRIEPRLLMERGVDPATIMESTVAGKEYTYVRIFDRTDSHL